METASVALSSMRQCCSSVLGKGSGLDSRIMICPILASKVPYLDVDHSMLRSIGGGAGLGHAWDPKNAPLKVCFRAHDITNGRRAGYIWGCHGMVAAAWRCVVC